MAGWVYQIPSWHKSDRLAECLCESAVKNFPGHRIRTDMSDGDMDWEKNFYLLRKSLCVAVLTENFFQDSLSEVQFLQSESGKQAIIDTHTEALIHYINTNFLHIHHI